VADASQTLDAVIAGCEAAWASFGGAFKVIIPDNMKAIVAKADAVNPVLTQGWLDYAQHCGQIVFLAKHLAGSSWRTLSIPRGRSREVEVAKDGEPYRPEPER
jgi:transposase